MSLFIMPPQHHYAPAPTSCNHWPTLRDAYRTVGDRTWQAEDFSTEHLARSRNLFTADSLAARQPRPKPLEVFALLSGLPFADEFITPLIAVQEQLTEILDHSLHYWVAAANFGIEYCVFKWPDDPWDAMQQSLIDERISALQTRKFSLHINGIQINPDGCVVARGFDQPGELFRIRAHLKALLPFLPARQSGWAHIPLGRILEPLGVQRFAQLGRLLGELADKPIAVTTIDTMKFIHETCWYMEERTALADYPLGGTDQREEK